MPHDRRRFLAGLSAAWACDPHTTVLDPFSVPGLACDDGLPGTFIGAIPFLDEVERTRPIGELYGEGLDARQILDLAPLTSDALVTPAASFYVRTAAPLDLGDVSDWAVTVDGLVAAPLVLPIDALLAQVEPMGTHHMECSGNGDSASFGLMSAGDFAGVRVSAILAQVEALPDAVAVKVTGRDTHPESATSEPGASWVYRLDELADAWLVTHQDGAPLLADHGAPVRLLVPNWYGCANIKWVVSITFVDIDEPATSQMQEFASRTHQVGVPDLARDYAPAAAQCSAMAVRVEAWEVDGEPVHRVIGIVWGGTALPTALDLWMDDENLGPVEACGEREVQTWGLWQALLPKGAGGTVTLSLTASGVPARRLDDHYYDRVVTLG